MLNKKGFTLIELLAMMVILGILMAVTIPNITGIAEANKKQAYAEDALKFKNTVEYKIRSDENYIKPSGSDECVVVSLTHLLVDSSNGFVAPTRTYITVEAKGTEYEKAPYEGEYLLDYSYVVVKKNTSNEYEYYVQLIEKLPSSAYRGISLTNYTKLESNNYLNEVKDFTLTPGMDLMPPSGIISSLTSAKTNLKSDGSQVCSGGVKAIYYANGVRVSDSFPGDINYLF